MLFTSTAAINRRRRADLRGGIDALQTGPPGRRRGRWWVGMIVRRVVTLTPSGFGFAHSRWSCEAAAVVLREDHGVRVSRETIRCRSRCRRPDRCRPRRGVADFTGDELYEQCWLAGIEVRQPLAALPPSSAAAVVADAEVVGDSPPPVSPPRG